VKVQQVAIKPTSASQAAGRPSLTPELLAATGARYSRNNEGLESIVEKIDPNNPEASVDSIFRMVDYGHQSILDMVPVAMFIDGISLWLAYYLWSLSPTAGGQESSTRYIKLSPEGIVSPQVLGIPEEQIDQWSQSIENAFSAYTQALSFWETVALANPEAIKIPKSLIADDSDKSKKTVARMIRNFAFDRARYFLPIAAATNVMLVMSARGWVNLCQYLLSHPLPESQQLGELVRSELALATSRMLRHATAKPSITNGLLKDFDDLFELATATKSTHIFNAESTSEEPCKAFLDISLPSNVIEKDLLGALQFHDNRYSWVGSALQRTFVRFGWNAVTFAEIRDLNRHRTGTKHCPFVPRGFYCANDQLASIPNLESDAQQLMLNLSLVGKLANALSYKALLNQEHTYVYWLLLGAQFFFEHSTTADKFIYEAELRTGTGAHYKYAEHLREVLALWYERFPSTKNVVLEGSNEPE
jgi:thymidylate synthase ThyX